MTYPFRAVVGVSGQKGSGKTTFARFLAARPGFALLETGQILRQQSQLQYGNMEGKSILALADAIRRQEGVMKYCIAKAPSRGGVLVVDSIKEQADIEPLSIMAPIRYFVEVVVERKLSDSRVGDRSRFDDLDGSLTQREKIWARERALIRLSNWIVLKAPNNMNTQALEIEAGRLAAQIEVELDSGSGRPGL